DQQAATMRREQDSLLRKIQDIQKALALVDEALDLIRRSASALQWNGDSRKEALESSTCCGCSRFLLLLVELCCEFTQGGRRFCLPQFLQQALFVSRAPVLAKLELTFQ